MKKLVIAMLVMSLSFITFGRTEYLIELKFTQSSVTLDLWQHIKDSANSFSITLPTTKEFYDSLKVGQELSSKFKTASFLLDGNIGKRKIIVKNKFTKNVK